MLITTKTSQKWQLINAVYDSINMTLRCIRHKSAEKIERPTLLEVKWSEVSDICSLRMWPGRLNYREINRPVNGTTRRVICIALVTDFSLMKVTHRSLSNNLSLRLFVASNLLPEPSSLDGARLLHIYMSDVTAFFLYLYCSNTYITYTIEVSVLLI